MADRPDFETIFPLERVLKGVDAPDSSEFAARIRRCAQALGRDGVDALGGLYDATASRLIRYAGTITGRRDDAEDALHAALVRIARKPRVLAEARHPWSYLLKMIRNEAINILRRRRPTRVLRQHAVVNPEDILFDENDLPSRVRSALDKLPSNQAEVVVLKIWEEMTFAEIGDVLGQSPNTAASRYRYALQKLAQSLHELEAEVRHG